MKARIIFAMVCFVAGSAAGQNTGLDTLKIDSLQIALSNGANKYAVYRKLVLAYGDIDNPTAYRYALKLYNLSIQRNDTTQIVDAGTILGQILRRLEKYDSCKIVFLKTLPIARKPEMAERRATMLSCLSIVYSFEARYDKALSCLMECLRIPNLADFPDVQSSIYHHLGYNYYKLSEYDKSIFCSKKALEIKRSNDITYRYNEVTLNVSLCYIKKEDIKNARQFLDEVIELADSADLRLSMEIHFNLGEVHLLERDTVAAEMCFLKSLVCASKFQERRFELDNLDALASINLNRKNFKKTKYYLTRAMHVPKDNSVNREVINLYARLGQFYQAISDFKQASFYQEKHRQLNDSIYSDKLTSNLVKLESEYVEYQNKERIAEQAQLLSFKDEIIHWQYLMIGAGAIILAFVVFTLRSLYRRHQQKKIANLILEEKVRQRTDVYSTSLSRLNRALIVNEERTKRTFQEITNAMTAIEVLCSLGADDSDNRMIYFQDIRKLSSKLMQHIDSVARERTEESSVQ